MSASLALLLAAAPVSSAGPVTSTSHAESPASSQSVHELIVPAPRSSVWQAVSTAEGWRGWAARNAWLAPGEPDVFETSYDPNAAPGAAGNIKSRIILKIPERIFAYRTVKAPAGFADFDALAAVTWLIELEPVTSGTRVRLTGSGFPRTPAGERILQFFLKHNPVALRGLHDRFVRPATPPGKG